MIYMFLSNNPSSGDINWPNLSCFEIESVIQVGQNQDYLESKWA